MNADPLSVIGSALVDAKESVAVIESVDDELVEVVVSVPITINDSLEYVVASPSFE